MDFQDMLKDAQLLRRTVPVCLRGDLVAQIEEAERELETLERRAVTEPDTSSIEEERPTVKVARTIEALRAEMTDHSYTFVIQALPGAEYRSLKAKHPPRVNEDGDVISDDRYLDANIETLPEPLLRACCVDPVLDDTTWADLESKLSDRQYSELAQMAIYVNRGAVDVPFSHAASRLLRSNSSE